MILIVISSPVKLKAEAETVNQMFDSGLDYFHLRKENESDLIKLIEQIDTKYIGQTVLHQSYQLAKKYNISRLHQKDKNPDNNYKFHSRSFHKLDQLPDFEDDYQYCFISPVFNSISKRNYKNNFTEDTLKQMIQKLKKLKLIALGGIQPETALRAKSIGFSGIASLGYLWNENSVEKRIQNFLKLQEICKNE